MINSIPEIYRRISVQELFKTNTFSNCWEIWQPKINEILGSNYNEQNIIDLGDHLTDIFRTTGSKGRGQGELSGGGTAWESLVCWYINLCTIGSRIVAVKKMSLVPLPIQNAITINYGNFACNTESDITILIFPNVDDFTNNIMHVSNQKITSVKLFMTYISQLVQKYFEKFEIGIVQCKTNWNDNAQIPMLWDMIYSSNGFSGRNITIGRENFNINQAKKFTYSFATVPSNKNTHYKTDSVAVKRVTNLSGGNYWGKPTQQNIARSLKEIFNNNFQSGFRKNIREDIRLALPLLKNELLFFNL
jgi:hypothetical protein